MRKLYSICIAFFILSSAYAQNSKIVENYDLNKKRLLIQFCSLYLFNSNQGTIDADSTVVLTCQAYKLPVSLSYDHAYNDGKFLIGSDLIERGDINGAKQLLTTAKGEDRMKILVQLAGYYLFKPGAKTEDLKNSFFYINQAIKDSDALKLLKWKHISLTLLGKYYAQANNLEASKRCFLIIANHCRKKNDKKALAEAIENQANYLPANDPQKLKLLQEANTLYKQVNFPEKVIETNMNMNTIYFWSGNFNMSKKILYQSLIDMRKIGFEHQQFSETTIAYIESRQFNTTSALYYALKCVQRMEATNDYTFSDIFYFRLANIYINMKHYEEAIEMLKKCINTGPRSLNNVIWHRGFIAAIKALSFEGKNEEIIKYMNSIDTQYPPIHPFDKMYYAEAKGTVYGRLKKYDQADKNFSDVDQYGQQIISSETFFDVQTCYSTAAAYYAKRHLADKAKYFTDKIMANSQSLHKRFVSTDLESALFLIDSLNGNYQSAIKHSQAFKTLSDSIEEFSVNRQIEELKIQYETTNKEQRISLLNKQSNLQKNALEKSRLLINFSIGGLILLLIILGLLFFLYRVKQKNNVILEKKEKEINLVNKEINMANSNLRKLLDEKEWLVREVHHRVKNNLQTVISLLSSQSVYLDNDIALSAIKVSQHRIHAMSLIHQKLYSSENISTINMQNYISELVEYLKASFTQGQRIRFETSIDPLELDVAQAVPIGLILNEAITNSIKYAFPDDRLGIVSVTLKGTGDEKYLLTITDNGVGFDISASSVSNNSFGMTLIKGLSRDLKANFSIVNDNGTVIKIEFMHEFAKRVNFKLS